MSAELDALVAALRSLGEEQKRAIAQGVWNDPGYRNAFSKLPLKLNELVAHLCSLDLDKKEAVSRAIWSDKDYKTTVSKFLLFDLQSFHAVPEEAICAVNESPISSRGLLYIGDSLRGLGNKERGMTARQAYLHNEGIEHYTFERRSSQWVLPKDGKWICILYSAQEKDKSNRWFFGTSERVLRNKLSGDTMSAIIFLCESGAGQIAVREIGATRLKLIERRLSRGNGQLKFNVSKKEDGFYYLVGERLT